MDLHRGGQATAVGVVSGTDVSLLLATYNERENIAEVIDGVLDYLPPDAEVIVVDDDSPDGTLAAVEAYDDPRVRGILRTNARGLASAYRVGIEASRGRLVGWMDADLAMPADRLPVMIRACDVHDIVVGSRYVAGGRDIRAPSRVYSSVAINFVARTMLGSSVRDMTSGFVMTRRASLDRLDFRSEGHGEYFIEMLVAAERAGLRVAEVPYTLTERTRGVSKSAGTKRAFLRHGARYATRIGECLLKHGRL